MEAPVLILIVLALLVVVGGVALMSSKAQARREPLEPPMAAKGGSTATIERSDKTVLDEGGLDDLDLSTPTDGSGPADLTETDDSTELVDEATLEEAGREEVGREEVQAKATFRDRLTRARGSISGALASIVGRGGIDAETWDELEEALIRADVGPALTMELLDAVKDRVKSEKMTEPSELIEALKAETTQRLLAPIDLRKATSGPSIYLFVGVNGMGKTTTIGKIGKTLADDGAKVVMAAGDTFRAAAAEQLQTWAERSDAEFVRGSEGGDPSSVIFDAVAHAASVDADYVLADTAGRLHNKSNLMEELSKIRRVADKGEGEVAEVLLVLDATTGQNGLNQARVFTEAVDVTGVVLTKLDGSAKGGIVLAIQSELGIPVKLVGLGEGIEDLIPFDAEQFSEALFAQID